MYKNIKLNIIIYEGTMKKIFTTVLFLFSICANAQIETMVKRYVKGDPMTETRSHIIWQSRHVEIWEYDDGEVAMCVQNPSHIFNDDFSTKVGLYDAKGEMLSMSEKWHTTLNDGKVVSWLNYGHKKEDNDTIYQWDIHSDSLAYWPGQDPYTWDKIWNYHLRVTPKHILQYLKDHRTGYIRIISGLYGSYYYDVKARLQK